VGVKDKQRSTGPAYSGYGWGPGYSGVSTYEYREGTVITDLIEPTKKNLVWRTTIIAELEDSMKENAELANKAIKKAFENYPPSNKKE